MPGTLTAGKALRGGFRVEEHHQHMRIEDVNQTLASLVGHMVVLDTAGPITYIGRLLEVRPDGFWLEAADLRDRNEGHVTKERYICEARQQGVRANRRRIFVFSHVVISASALDDVITEYPPDQV